MIIFVHYSLFKISNGVLRALPCFRGPIAATIEKKTWLLRNVHLKMYESQNISSKLNVVTNHYCIYPSGTVKGQCKKGAFNASHL